VEAIRYRMEQAGLALVLGSRLRASKVLCQSALKGGSSALVVQVDGLRSDGRPYGWDIYGGLIPRFVSSCSAADPGRSIGCAGAARTPDRSVNALASWLKQHGQEVTTVSRDRSGAYCQRRLNSSQIGRSNFPHFVAFSHGRSHGAALCR
jgi:hypothetical protein